MTIAEQIKHLQGYPPETPCASGTWLPDDVRERAKEMGVRVTKKQIAEVLSGVHRGHDANYGITWDSIDAGIAALKRRKA